MSLTNQDKAKIDRVLANYRMWNWFRAIYVIGAILFCGYTSIHHTYGFWYTRIVSFVLTANVIWLYFDIFESPLKRMLKVIQEIDEDRNLNSKL